MGLEENVKKNDIFSENPGKVWEGGKFPCAACKKGVGSNFILCQFCRS